jgi:RND family efflux transporter MFP subunit
MKKSQISELKSQISNSGIRSQLLIVALCFAPFAFSGCREKTAAAEQPLTAVKIKTVESNPVSRGMRFSAGIEPARQVELAFKVSGYVDQLHQVRGVNGRMRDVQAGDRVAKGTALARLRQSEFSVKLSQAQSQASEVKSALEATRAQHAESQSAIASGKAQLAETQAAMEKARLDLERARNLFSTQSLTKADFDAAKSQYEAVEARQAAAQSQVAMLEAKERAAGAQIQAQQARVQSSQAMITEASIPLQDASLRAPMDGVILDRSVETGALVSPGKTGFVIADLTTVKAMFGASDLMARKLKLGAELIVTTESLAGVEFHGRITRISPSADPKSRVFEIEVSIPNPNQALKAGMIASIEIPAAHSTEAVNAVPVSAVVRDRRRPDQYAVFVVEEKGGHAVARSRVVKLGKAFGNMIAVEEGVGPGERVITTGASLVLDGQQVQVIP